MNTSNSSKKIIRRKQSNVLLTRNPWFKKGTKILWILFLCFVIGFPVYVLAVSKDLFGLFGGMPSLKSIENPENDLSSELMSADGVSLGRYFRYNRSQVSYDQLSPDLVNTLLLSEDHRYYDHSGLDFQAYLRVLWGMATFSSSAKGGGSTITQQLAKNLFSTRGPELEGTLTHGGAIKMLVNKTKDGSFQSSLNEILRKKRYCHVPQHCSLWQQCVRDQGCGTNLF